MLFKIFLIVILIVRIYLTKHRKLHIMRITHIHSPDGDTYVCVWSHKYRPLVNVNILFVLRLISLLFSKYFRTVSIS